MDRKRVPPNKYKTRPWRLYYYLQSTIGNKTNKNKKNAIQQNTTTYKIPTSKIFCYHSHYTVTKLKLQWIYVQVILDGGFLNANVSHFIRQTLGEYIGFSLKKKILFIFTISRYRHLKMSFPYIQIDICFFFKYGKIAVNNWMILNEFV